MAGFKVIICGAGIAGIEGLLRLRRLAGDRVEITLLSPGDDFAYRPLAVLEPFTRSSIRRYPLAQIAADTGAGVVSGSLARIDTEAREAQTHDGLSLPYDALLLALGAGESAPFDHAHVFTDRDAGQDFREIVEDLEKGRARSVAFVVPNWPVWPMPLYELALMTAERAHTLQVDAQISLITPEARPLKAFGQAAGDVIAGLLSQAGIELHVGVVATVPAPGVVSLGETRLEADRIVTLPRVTGPAIQGISAGPGWFVPIDDRCVVRDAGGCVFAAGDATDFPIKHGGIGAQQADTAAAGIAHLAGAIDRPPPLKPVIRSMLLTGARPLYLVANVVSGLGWSSEVYEQPPWQAEDKVVAEELGPYLARLDAVGAASG
ncbi:MAG: NAD(P)/FAD-dependent oxidoreductase [Solirubrobacteraceae bacterium]